MDFKDSTLVERQPYYSLVNSAGLKFSINENGTVKSIRQGGTQINLIPGSSLEAGCINLYLRIRGNKITAVPLLGPNSCGSQFLDENSFQVKGEFEGVAFSCRLLLAEKDASWLWDVQFTNASGEDRELDLLYVQDVGLVDADGNEKNELYVSQYIDYTPLHHQKHGCIVCCRQNERGNDGFPWLALGSISQAHSFSTDGMQFFGPAYKETGVAQGLVTSELAGLCQQEFAVVGLQEKPFVLGSGQSRCLGFFGIYCPNRALPTSPDVLEMIESRLDQIKMLSVEPWSENDLQEPTQSVFSESDLYVSEDLTEDEINQLFAPEHRHREYSDGKLLSFFYGENRHVVLKAKELLTERPHGHIMKTGTGLEPDEAIMSFSAHMFGVFQSHVAQGNVNFNRLLTLSTNALNIPRHTGQRIFIRHNGRYYQLAVPSAFEMSQNGCRWMYKRDGSIVEIVSAATPEKAEIVLRLRVLKGLSPQWLITNQLTSEHAWSVEQDNRNDDEHTLKLIPGRKTELARMFPNGFFTVQLENAEVVKRAGGDELLFVDGKSRVLPFLTVELAAAKQFTMRISSLLAAQTDTQTRKTGHPVKFTSNGNRSGADEIIEILPWFIQNAQIHYLAPRGIEQYGGAAWGTRDVCQGPAEMLLSLGHFSTLRKILSVVFANQNSDGTWPQWWMPDRYRQIRHNEAHGDVVFWPMLAVSQYIRCSGDYAFLEEMIPFYHETKQTVEQSSVSDHILRIIEHVKKNRFAGKTALVNYDGGDWNDAMQPANEELKNRLISSWTVILSYQAFTEYAQVCRNARHGRIADELENLSSSIQTDFNRFLVKDGVTAGFGLIGQNGAIDLLLHPSDSITGVHYSLLPMTRGILSGIFSQQQARLHFEIIEQQLKGPDGARLMDCSPVYQGGLQHYFKRAESCPFFGREIGLMYTHAHLRYAESLARLGRGEEFLHALRQVVPIGIQKIIPQADIRQSNCYFSSSDAYFKNRYEANSRYKDLIAGKIRLKGGWRIYSSGPGLFVGNVISGLLGIRQCFGYTVFDPVMPKEVDGLTVQMRLADREVMLIYCISGAGQGVKRIEINGADAEFGRESNPYRVGGAVIENAKLRTILNATSNTIKIGL